MLVVCDVYVRSLARSADGLSDPSWAATLVPASEQVRANIDGLRDVLVRGRRASDGGQVRARSAERLVDAAEEHAARRDDPHRRTAMLGVGIHFGKRAVNGGISIWLCQTAAAPAPAGTNPPMCPTLGTVTGDGRRE